MASGRFKIHDPAQTHILTLRISNDLYDQIRDEVEYDRTTIQKIATQILRDGIEIRQIQRLNKAKTDHERREKLRQAAQLIGTRE